MALLTADCPPVYWFGQRVGPSDLLVFPSDGSIDSISRPGFCTLTFCVDTDDLAGYFECAGGPDLDRVLGDGPTAVRLAPSRLQTLRSHLEKVSFDPRELRQSLALFDAYRDRLFALLLAIFRDGRASTPRRDVLQRHRLLTDFATLVDHHRDEALSLPALSALLDVPERTLSGVFRREVGMSPASFAKGYRLFGAHRALWQARSHGARVADIANAWGFWHLGQFAADYRRLFGELPKRTLLRSPSDR